MVTTTGDSVRTIVVVIAGMAVDISVWTVAGPSATVPSAWVMVTTAGPELAAGEELNDKRGAVRPGLNL